MKKRLLTGIVLLSIIGIFFGLRQFNVYLFDILIGVILVCGSAEISRVFIRSKHYNNMTLATMFPILYYLGFVVSMQKGFSFGFFVLTEVCLLVVMVLITFLWTILDRKTYNAEIGDVKPSKYVAKKVFLTAFIMVYPTFLLGNMFILNHTMALNWFNSLFNSNLGLFLLLTLFAITMSTDTMAYLVGSLLKGPKLCPYISPKKTISGAVGGLLGGIISSIVAFIIVNNIEVFNTFFVTHNINIWAFVLLGFIGPIFTQIGDIFASWLKRKALTKDFSSIFPGHGGFMDRCDGLSFSAVVMLVFSLIVFA